MSTKKSRGPRDRRAQNRGFVVEIHKPDGTYDHTKSFEDPDAAEAYYIAQRAAQAQRVWVSPKDGAITFGDWWAHWYGPAAAALARGTRNRDQSYADSHILPTFATTAIGDIDASMIQRWVAERIEAGYKPATVRKAHGIVSKALKAAVADRLIINNPCDHTSLPKMTPPQPIADDDPDDDEDEGEVQILDYDEIEELGVCLGAYSLAGRLDAYTGLRFGELFGLEVRDVKVERSRLAVRRKIVEAKGAVHFEQFLKTDAGRREVWVPSELMDELAIHVKDKQPRDLVFTAPRGGPVHLSSWRWRFWYPACIKLGRGTVVACTETTTTSCEIPHKKNRVGRQLKRGHYRGLRFHDLRHTAVSLWVFDGRPLFEITKMIGQADSKLIDNRYGHLVTRTTDATNEALNRRIRDARARRAKTDDETPLRPLPE
jgi:integrase